MVKNAWYLSIHLKSLQDLTVNKSIIKQKTIQYTCILKNWSLQIEILTKAI